MLNSIYGIYPPDLLLFLGKDFPAYRGKQLLDWLYRKFVFEPERMTNLPAGFREHLSRSFDFSVPAIDQELLSDASLCYDGAEMEWIAVQKMNLLFQLKPGLLPGHPQSQCTDVQPPAR